MRIVPRGALGCVAFLLLASLTVLSDAPAVAAGEADPDRVRTEGMVSAYHQSEAWAVRAVALSNLGTRWHPKASGIVLDALQSKDRRLRAYGVAALTALSAEDLRVVLSAELLENLAAKQSRHRSKVIRNRVHGLLLRAFPAAGVDKVSGWTRWWRKAREGYAAPAWTERAPEADEEQKKDAHRTTSGRSISERALELSQARLELVVVLDTTGSMQLTIDAARAGLGDLFTILDGIAKEFRVGLVHYRERGELGGMSGPGAGAKMVESLTPKVANLTKRLDAISANGGGDFPERIEAGLHYALHKDMKWSREASKMVVIIGDAPPHADTMKGILETAKRAQEAPDELIGGRRRRPVVTGGSKGKKKRRATLPIVISCVGVGAGGVVGQTSGPMRKIAEAGGGVYAALNTKADPRVASNALVSRLVEVSFGAEYVEAARRFVATFFDYADAGYPMR